ncbi:MAG: exodeoxyribonuclease VII large subunit, partial [Anaerolineae bacterium]|nr:exodeoxyribonuclease VII large subunit [Anaerolineae bacterium]
MSEQLSLFQPEEQQPQSVSEVTRYIRQLFERDLKMQAVWIEGEVSNYKRAASGHLYFSLKDEEAQLKCVMWRTAAARLSFEPAHGDQVIVWGSINVYEPQGVYQMYVEVMQPAGIGDLNRQFELLKSKLAAEGLFDAEKKKPIPAFPRKIGIVTSPDAAGFRDVLNILSRRYPAAEIILSPTQVQGDTAPPLIVRAVEMLNQRQDIDVMLIVRGGGSLEDLWCFNDERVVRAVAASKIPTIAGVGHEIDFTLVDFAADLRAPTPSAAAEIATPNGEDILYTVRDSQKRMESAVYALVEEYRDTLEGQKRTLRLLSPQNRIHRMRQQVDDLSTRAATAARVLLRQQRQEVAALQKRLEAANPDNILKRGYAIVTRTGDGLRMNSVQQAAPGTGIVVKLQDGELKATV